MKIYNKKIICLILIGLFLFSTNVTALKISYQSDQVKNSPKSTNNNDTDGDGYPDAIDIDPLVNLSVTVKITQIRSLEQPRIGTFLLPKLPISKINLFKNPNFYVTVVINGVKFKSPIWHNKKYVNNPNWSATLDVPDNKELVNVRIQLWDFNLLRADRLCDLSGLNNGDAYGDKRDVNLTYDLKTGHWSGDDYIGDPSGYGRLNGCDDGSINQNDRDCELWFDITQNTYNGDGIPYWTEVNIYGLDPKVSHLGQDPNGDGIPIQWDWKWGYQPIWDYHNHTMIPNWIYDPFAHDNHSKLDPDNDGLSNYEEYLTSQWGSDPFRKDIFVELDQMKAGPNGEPASILPSESKDMLRTAFDKHNIVFHLDDGSMGGGEMIPFDNLTGRDKLVTIYQKYFLHGDNNNWRKGVFHYGLVVYDATYAGYVFGTNDGYIGGFQISSSRVDKTKHHLIPGLRDKAIAYASVYMHELGHTLNIQIPGGHDTNDYYPWQIGWWKWRPYKSCMNYGYTYMLVDYSDGSRGKNDHNDWGTLDLTYFKNYIE